MTPEHILEVCKLLGAKSTTQRRAYFDKYDSTPWVHIGNSVVRFRKDWSNTGVKIYPIEKVDEHILCREIHHITKHLS